jgi:hypothetical protein
MWPTLSFAHVLMHLAKDFNLECREGEVAMGVANQFDFTIWSNWGSWNKIIPTERNYSFENWLIPYIKEDNALKKCLEVRFELYY